MTKMAAVARELKDALDGLPVHSKNLAAYFRNHGTKNRRNSSELTELDDQLKAALPDMPKSQKAAVHGIENPTEGMTVYRIFGEAQDDIGGLERGSRPFGESWTPVDPRHSSDFRWDAGLPDENPGRFFVEGILRRPSHVTEVRPALPLDGNPGGWPEYLIRDAGDAVEIRSVGGVNQPWSRSPGDWTP
ncbi:MAG: hypothetical protein QM572_02135 [Nocardioides sp.]|uniref:hypothetical protein n=1 Tax=Nocardioides sp. TaxID=35761 RepID=UPI0039E3D5C7